MKKDDILVWAGAIFCMGIVTLYYQYHYPWLIWLLVAFLVMTILLLVRVYLKHFSRKKTSSTQERYADDVLNLAVSQYQQKNFAGTVLNSHYALYLYDKVVKKYDPALKTKQDGALKMLHLGCVNMKDYPSAVKYGTELLASKAQDVDVLCGMAIAKLGLQMHSSAKEYVQVALSVDPSNQTARSLLEKINSMMTK